MHYVYILRSTETKKFYIGYTTNPKQRLQDHNSGKNKSTKHNKAWQIIYLEGYIDKRDAIGREKFLKSGSGYRYLKKQLKHFLEQEA